MAGQSHYLTAIVWLITAKGGGKHMHEGGRESWHATNTDSMGRQYLYVSHKTTQSYKYARIQGNFSFTTCLDYAIKMVSPIYGAYPT